MHNLFFARPLAQLPLGLVHKLKAGQALTDNEENVFDNIAGLAPGYPEAFATQEARDAALGPFGPYAEFIPTSWAQMAAGQFAISNVAIGHRVGDPDFAKVAPQVLDAIARDLEDREWHDVVIHRLRYIVRRPANGAVKVCGWRSEFDAALDLSDGMETTLYLERELNLRLGSEVAQ